MVLQPSIATNEAGVTLGLSPGPLARLRDMEGKFTALESEAGARAQLYVGLIGTRLAEAIREEFAPHDRGGQTLRSLRVDIEGWQATVHMGYGAAFVEFGSAPHWIYGNPLLHWTDSEGEDWYVTAVFHPGYVGDPYLERALRKIDVEGMLRRIAYDTMVEVYGHAEDEGGNMYTQGQQSGGTLSGGTVGS